MSKTSNAAQRTTFHDDKPNEYPSTPQAFVGDPLKAYYYSLNDGTPFFRNHNGDYIVVKSGFSKDGQILYVMAKAAYVWRKGENGEYTPLPITELQEKNSIIDLPHALTGITYENGLFVHEKIESGFHPMEELEEIFSNYTQ